jgi:uncharacterized RDD family membrane protein YckC
MRGELLDMLKTWMEKRGFHAHETHRMDELESLPLASFRRRALAILVDVVMVLLLKLILGGLRHDEETNPHTVAGLMLAVAHRVEELLESFVYFAVVLKLGKGQTLGKWFMKIRVVSLTNDEVGWWQSVERVLGYGASLLEGGFGFFQYYTNRNRQTVHDRIAETIVVYEGKPGWRNTAESDRRPDEIRT